ncbi:MAG: ABC transporter permease [Planctomycetes bacterium]|nr:ABC transporter permease [Planctomycetota bacterium]
MILVIAGATFREATRSRSFVLLLTLYALGVLLSRVGGWISGTDGGLITANLVMSLQSVFGVLVAVATGTALVHSEIQQKTLYTVLSRPVARWRFVVGKFTGLALALVCGQAAMLALGVLYLWATGGAVSGWLAVAGALTAMEVLVMAAVSLCWAAVSSPLLATVLCLATYALGHAVGSLPGLMYHLKGFQRPLCVAFASLVPDLSRFAYRDQAVHAIPIDMGDAGMRLVYGLCWICLLVTITVAVVRRKQL